jgi:acyl-CoA thioesterase I
MSSGSFGNLASAVTALRLLGFALLGLAAAASTATPTRAEPYACTDRAASLGRLSRPLTRMHSLISAGRTITIMALGSSSTAGAGASGPAASYPMRLQAELRRRFPGTEINVVNRGINGEEAADMLRRFDLAAMSDRPDVVLWQLGTNTVLRGHPLAEADRLIVDGLMRMKALDVDVVLIDPQFAPQVLSRRDAADSMVRMIAAASTSRSVDLFPRFKVMREWHEAEAIPFDAFMSPDLLHMNDWGYACFARLLGAAMADAATRPVTSAGAAISNK